MEYSTETIDGQISNLHEIRTLQQFWIDPLRTEICLLHEHYQLIPSSTSGPQISQPFAPFGRFTHSPPMCSAPSPPRHAAPVNSLPHITYGFPSRAPARQSRDSNRHPSLAARTLPRPPTPYPAWSPHSAELCPPPAVQLPHQMRVSRCSQRMRSRGTTLAPHDSTALAPSPRARSLDLRPQRGPRCPVMPIVDVPDQGTKVSGTRGTSRR